MATGNSARACRRSWLRPSGLPCPGHMCGSAVKFSDLSKPCAAPSSVLYCPAAVMATMLFIHRQRTLHHILSSATSLIVELQVTRYLQPNPGPFNSFNSGCSQSSICIFD